MTRYKIVYDMDGFTDCCSIEVDSVSDAGAGMVLGKDGLIQYIADVFLTPADAWFNYIKQKRDEIRRLQYEQQLKEKEVTYALREYYRSSH